MAITVVQTKGGSGSGTTATATFSPAATAGNLMVGCLFTKNDGGWTNPSGWTTAKSVHNSSNVDDLVIAYKVAVGGETAISFSLSGGDAWALNIYEINSTATWTSPLDAAPTGTGFTTGISSIAAPASGTIAQAEEILVACAGVRNVAIILPGVDSSYTPNPPDDSNFTDAGSNIHVYSATRIVSSVSSYGCTFSWTNNADAMALNVSFKAADAGTSIAIPAGSLSLTGLATSVFLAFNLGIPAGSVAFTGLAPTTTVSGATTIAIPVGTVAVTGYAPQVMAGNIIAIPAGSVAYAGQFVAVAFGGEIQVGQLTFTGYAPVVNVQSPGQIQIPIPVGAYTFTGYAPVGSLGMNIDIPAGSLVWQGYALSIDAPHSIAIPAGSLVWTGRALSVLNGGRLPQGDLTTQVAIWMRTLPAGGNINTRIRDAICTLYGLNPDITDITPAFARFTRDRN